MNKKHYFINNNPITAMMLPKIFLGRSSRSCKNIAAATKTTTILKVVIAETILKFPTTKINMTHDSDCINLSPPVMAISFLEYGLLLCMINVAIPKKIH